MMKDLVENNVSLEFVQMDAVIMEFATNIQDFVNVLKISRERIVAVRHVSKIVKEKGFAQNKVFVYVKKDIMGLCVNISLVKKIVMEMEYVIMVNVFVSMDSMVNGVMNLMSQMNKFSVQISVNLSVDISAKDKHLIVYYHANKSVRNSA